MILRFMNLLLLLKEGYNQGHISAVCLGKRKYHRGYKWMYLSDYEALNKSKNESPDAEN